ncbi:efflux RND transporter permease subunit [Aciduricibacillus chroicocephali]|uniref:Efflux RND transporter permease subunit n=1 Tax=Aciduricibacillus chroicocephali TaxID=3054939 RepID=A0ABY9KTR9_9BACI|nr:efflux RND transporter permease subunit [Bacillaceae bacterium 44XB]
MKMVHVSVKRPVGVIMIVLAVIALGIVSLRNLAIELFPKIDLPVAVVATTYGDSASADVEKLISRPIEGAVSSVEGIEKVQSQSQPGSSLVIMMFKNGTNLDQALLDVREKVDQAKGGLPDGAGTPNIMRFSPDQLPVMWISLAGKDAESLTQIAEDQVIPYFERQTGVASVTAEGEKEREIQIILDENKMHEKGIDAQVVRQALNSANHASSVGTIQKGTKDLQLRVTGEFVNIEEIRSTVVQNGRGERLHLSDIAKVDDAYKKASTVTLVNGKPSIVLSIMKKTDSNIVEVADEMHAALGDLKKDLPQGVKTKVVLDSSDFIRVSIDSVIQNMIIGGLISVIVLLLFLKSVRATLVIGLSIPIAIISTFALMYFTGETLNVLTLGGLALGIGMMVDSSIVILEHIYSYRQRGFSLYESATKGASELAPAVIASTTTTLVVFFPIIYVKGVASDLFTPLALAVCYSLIASLVVALTLVPMLSSKLLAAAVEDSGRRYWFNSVLNWFTNKYQGALKKVLKFRKTTIFVTLGLTVASLFLIPFIGAEFLPSSDQGQLQIKVETPPGSSLKHTKNITDEVNAKLEKHRDIITTNYTSVGGGGFGRMGGTSNEATFRIELVPAADRTISTDALIQQLNKEMRSIKGADIAISGAEEGMGTGSPVQIELHGLEHEELRYLSDRVLREIADVKGVRNPESSVTAAVPQMAIQVDEEKAADYGLNEEAVASQVEAHFNGQFATRYREAGHEMDVTLYYPKENRQSIKDLKNIDIETPAGTTVKLEDIAFMEEQEGPVTLLRQNQQPQINITSEIGGGRDLKSVTKDIESRLDTIDFPDGYGYEIGGQAADMEKSFHDLGLALIFSIFLVYAVMAVQFENFLYPFIIMFAMPATTIGVFGGLFITGLPLSIPALIGVIMLAGIVVNNSIVLVDYINILRRNGMSRYEAILHAGPSRLRPILMTTLTTVLGMVPLALALGEGAETQQPLAVTIIFGLTVSTIFTLLFVPVVYTLLDDLSDKVMKKRKEKAAEQE